jgi:hypothetical protein
VCADFFMSLSFAGNRVMSYEPKKHYFIKTNFLVIETFSDCKR